MKAAALACLFLACGSVISAEQAPSVVSGTDPVPSNLLRAVTAYTRMKKIPSPLSWALVDLNGDDQDDAIVLLTGTTWCRPDGCTMLVYRGDASGEFTFISGTTIASRPVRVWPEKNHGWSSLIVKSREGDAVVSFDGKRYPLNASTQPVASAAQLQAAQIAIK
jgi:hypothetical protein